MKNYEMLTMLARGSGKTTAVCKAAQEQGFAVVVHNQIEASRLKKLYGDVKFITFDQFETLRGTKLPMGMLVDSHAAAMELLNLQDEIVKYKRMYEEVKQQLDETLGGMKAILDR